MSRDRAHPPSEWFPGATRLTDDTYVAIAAAPAPNPVAAGDVIVWHWCEPVGRWEGAHCAAHTLHAVEPLHLEPSLACARNSAPPGEPTCSWHGWIRAGKWTDA